MNAAIVALALTPASEEARDWAREELADPKYQESQLSFFERISRAVERFFDFLFTAATSHDSLPLFIAAVIILTAAAVWVILRLRRGSGDAFDSALFAGQHPEAGIDPDALRAQAEQAAGRQDYSAACQDMVRAIVAEAARAGIVDLTSATTAGEVTRAAAAQHPHLAARLAAAARLFDSVTYGEYRATADDYAQVRALDADVRTAVGVPA